MAGLNKTEFKGQIILYSVQGCVSCAKVKSILAEMGLPVYDIDLAKYSEHRKVMFDLTGSRVVPQLFFNEKHAGGYHELKKLLLSGEFESLLKEVLEKEPPAGCPTIPEELLQMNREQAAGAEEQSGCNCGDEECNIFDDSSDSDEEKGATGFNRSREHHSRRKGTVFGMDDEYAGVANEIKFQSGVARTKLTLSLRKINSCFAGKDLVRYLMERKGKSQEEAIQVGEQLLRRSFIYHITHERNFQANDNLYAFLDDSNKNALNVTQGEIPPREQKPAIMLAAEMKRSIQDLFVEFLRDNGFSVDYAGLAASQKFLLYRKVAGELQRVIITGMTREQTISFTINIYNALVIHAFASHAPPSNLLKRFLFYGSACYMIGGFYFTLNELESGILRANRKPVGAISVPFRRNDPRAQFALAEVEPRIHFALNCGAVSCPPIRAYSAAKIDEELTIATQGFLENDSGVMVDMAKREIILSKIFQWYKVDFGGSNRTVAEWVLHHMVPSEKSRNVTALVESGNFKVKYQSYNWNVNNA